MRYQNKKGFFLIETIAACALLVAISSIITWYIATMSSCHRKAKEQLMLFRLMQSALYTNNNERNIVVEQKPFYFTAIELQRRGYNTRFHDKLMVKRASALQENKKTYALSLATICLKENNV